MAHKIKDMQVFAGSRFKVQRLTAHVKPACGPSDRSEPRSVGANWIMHENRMI